MRSLTAITVRPVRLVIRAAACAWLLGAAAFRVHAQAEATGSVTVSVRTGEPQAAVPYAVVSIPALSIERFSNSSGAATLTGVPAGPQRVLVRRMGFVPFTAIVTVEAGRTVSVEALLRPLPVRLARMEVRDVAACLRPGVPDSVLEPDVFQLVGLMRENAEQFRVLARQHPFSYTQVRALGGYSRFTFHVSQIDSILIRSDLIDNYRAGEVVRQVENRPGELRYSMMLPGIVDLADDEFVTAHCFGFGGVLRQKGQTLLRLVVRAADALEGSDVHGELLIDSTTSQLVRMDLELSSPDRLPISVPRVRYVRSSTTFRDLAPGLSVIDRVCALVHPREDRDLLTLPAELQQLLGYTFEIPPPGVAGVGVNAIPRAWRAGGRLPLRDVWCLRPR
jgi:hypothetical protein